MGVSLSNGIKIETANGVWKLFGSIDLVDQKALYNGISVNKKDKNLVFVRILVGHK